ncbi:MAG TPA: hypothetical protein ENN77_00790, partial [Candidatus Wirthbacteria bacterium]|nr:hypothetical protein [Candidatus Wirthbacteria bacterium]
MQNEIAKTMSLESLVNREWILPNGLGGYASGTFSGINTRKYHGLLVGGFEPNGGRYMYLAHLEERIFIGEHRFFISAHKYLSDSIYPRGFIHLLDYGLKKQEVWFRFGKFRDYDLQVIKRIRSLSGKQQVLISYEFVGQTDGVRFDLLPLVTRRNIHTVRRDAPYHSERGADWTSTLPFDVCRFLRHKSNPNLSGFSIKYPQISSRLYIGSHEMVFNHQGEWYHDFQYDLEMQRGY